MIVPCLQESTQVKRIFDKVKLNWIAFKGLITAAFIAGSVLLTVPAKAGTYQAGDFTITITDGNIYTGCDRNGNCITLDNYLKWRHNGRRGIAWRNGEYTYSVSWQEEAGNMILRVLKGDEVLAEEEMLIIGEQLKLLRYHVKAIAHLSPIYHP